MRRNERGGRPSAAPLQRDSATRQRNPRPSREGTRAKARSGLGKVVQAKREERPMARERLKEARKAAGMTQQAVAYELGISLRHYCHIEAGTRMGDFQLWDELEDLFSIHQRKLRLCDPEASRW